jgi:hypothetical protein
MKIEIEIDDEVYHDAVVNGWNLRFDEDIEKADLPMVGKMENPHIEDFVHAVDFIEPDDITMTRIL